MLELKDSQMREIVENVVGPDRLPSLKDRIEDGVVLLEGIEPGVDLEVAGVVVRKQARGEREDGNLHDVGVSESQKIVESLGPELTAPDTWWNRNWNYKDITLVQSSIVSTDGKVVTEDGVSSVTDASHLLIEETYRYPTQKESYQTIFVLHLTTEKENELLAQAKKEQ